MKNEWVHSKFDEMSNKKGNRYATATMLASVLSAIEISAALDALDGDEKAAEANMKKTMETVMPYLKMLPEEYVKDAFAIADTMGSEDSIYDAADRYYAGKENESDVANETENH